MQNNSLLPHMTYTDLRKKPPRAAAPPENAAPQPVDPPNGFTPADQEFPPTAPEHPATESTPQEQPETDAAPLVDAAPEDPAQPTAEGAAHDSFEPLHESLREGEEFFTTGEECGNCSPDTPPPIRPGEQCDENFTTNPLDELYRQMNARFEQDRQDHAEAEAQAEQAQAAAEQEQAAADRARRRGVGLPSTNSIASSFLSSSKPA